MDLGESHGGLPPDSLVEDARRRSSPTPSGCAAARRRQLQIVVAPCSPFSVTRRADDRVGRAGAAARAELHTHLAETVEEEAYCQRALRLPAGRVPRAARLARRRRLVRALRPPLRRRRRPLRARPASASRTARPRTCGSARASRGCASCSTRASASASASTARRRTSAATSSSRSSRRCSSRAAAAAREALTARDALRLGTRGGAAVLGARRHRLARAGQARRPRRLADRRARARAAPTTPSRGSSSRPAPRRPALRRRRGGRPRRAARARRRAQIAQEHRVQARSSPR